MASRPLPLGERRLQSEVRVTTATPELRHFCDIDVEAGPIRDLGATPHGRRRIIPILGGRVRGPRIAADVLQGGADWQYLRADGVLELVARYSMLTSDGVEIAITNRGLRRHARDHGAIVARRAGRSRTRLFPRRAGVRGANRPVRVAQPQPVRCDRRAVTG